MSATANQRAVWEYRQPKGERAAWPIFPLVPGTKIPYKDSRGFLDATTDGDRIKQWWTKEPDANIGLATGRPSGVLVLDIDNKNGHDGSGSLAKLEAKWGKLPDTVEALTPNDGRHIYFSAPELLPVSSAKELVDGIDVRSDGGYVVLPPSRLSSGRPYEWENSYPPDTTPLAKLPSEWLDLFVEKGAVHLKAGERNDTIFRYGCSLWARSYTEERLTQLLTMVNNNAAPPLKERELALLIRSITKYPQGTSTDQITPFSAESAPQKKPRLTIAALASELEARNIGIRHNEITGEMDTTGRTPSGRVMQMSDIVATMHSEIADTYRDTGFDTLTQYAGFIARENGYNPILDLLAATRWDGIDRVAEVYNLLSLSAEDALSRTLVNKWLLQSVALLFNTLDDPYGADGCLVLNGEQGTGKTSFFRHLAIEPKWFCEGGLIDDRDKDTTRRVLTVWLAELGEVESTLKSDIARLKAFITKGYDTYRLPYGREDVKAPRHTSLCATCNSERYLIDQTGERRWWTVPIAQPIPRAELEKLDALQLWAQIYATVAQMGHDERKACYRLNEHELLALAFRNGDHEKLVKGQAEVADIIQATDPSDPSKWAMLTITEFKQRHDALRSFSTQQLGVALKACGITTQHTKTGAKALLPRF